MQRWMHSAAGGTSQRLKPGPAIVRCLASRLPSRPGLALATAAAEPDFTLLLIMDACLYICPAKTLFADRAL